MGVILLAIFAGTTQSIEGAVLQMVNHGIIIAALFLIASAIEARTGTRRLADFGGLATKLPWLSTVFLIVSLAALGLPGLNSFAGEFLAFLGTFQANLWQGVLATAVVVPAAWYMLRFFQGVTEGPLPERGPVATALAPATAPSRGNRGRHGRAATTPLLDLRPAEAWILLPLVALIIVLGVAPGLLVSRLQRSDGAVATGTPPPFLPPGVGRLQGGGGTAYIAVFGPSAASDAP
jgi:NADH-quinone oxidoreductase subunit M